MIADAAKFLIVIASIMTITFTLEACSSNPNDANCPWVWQDCKKQ